MAGLPMNSILEELRCMDGELFRSELTQRLYLLLKTQAEDALASCPRGSAQMKQVHAKILEWPALVRDEELQVLRRKSSEIDTLFVQVAMLYVKLSHKSTENRIVKISRPRIEDLVRSFYQAILHNPWGSSGELWTFDPIKSDFVLRECFRKAVMESVQVLQSQAPPSMSSTTFSVRKDNDTEIGPDDSISNFLGPDAAPTFAPAPSFHSLPPPPPLERSKPHSDHDSHSTLSNSTSSSESSVHNRPIVQSSNSHSEFQRHAQTKEDAEYERDKESSDDDTILQPRQATDSGTVIRGVSNDSGTVRLGFDNRNQDAGTVRLGGKQASDTRTVTFQLPKGPGSVISSVSDSSNGSRYMTAMLHKPVLQPVDEQPQSSLRIQLHDDIKEESDSDDSDRS